MNTSPPRRHRSRLAFALLFLASLTLASAQITVDGTANWNNGSSPVNGTFDASGSDKLVVVVTGEHGFNNDAGTVNSITYDGVALIPIIQRNAQVSGTDTIYQHMYYLDNPATSTGLIEVAATTRGNVTVFGLSGTAPGFGATAITPTDTRTVSLTTTAADSLVIVSFGMGGAGNTANVTAVTSDAPLTQVSAQENGNNWDGHVVGWADAATPGSQTYGFTGGNIDGSMVIAAEFLLAGPDVDGPVLVSTDPADDAIDVPVGQNLVATFDENITPGTGNIIIKNLTGTIDTTIAIDDTTQVSFANKVLTIDPVLNLLNSTDYAIQIESGAIFDDTTNSFAGIIDTTTWNFTTIALDAIAPTLDLFNDDKGGGPIFETETVVYTLTFSEAMTASTIEVADFENGGSPAATINSVTATANPAVFEVSVSPGGPGTLQLQVKAGANLEDLAGNPLDTTTAVADPVTITVDADLPPTVVSIVDNFSGGPIFETQTVTYTVTFDQAMNASTVEVADFGDTGTPGATIDSATATGDPAVFEVAVTPGGAGTIQLQINMGAGLEDTFGSSLDTAAAIPDDTTITVNAGSPPPLAEVTIDGTANWNNGSSPVNGTFDASGSDKLVVVVTGEHGFNNDAGTVNSITYDGVALIPIIQRNAQVSGTDTIYQHMYYLDNPATSTGLIEVAATTRGNVTVFGLSGTAPGFGATAITPTDTRTVSLTTTAADSLVIVSFGMGGAGNTANVTAVTSDAPLTQVSAQENGNNWDGHVVGWAKAPTPGSQTYSFTGGNIDGSMVIAAEFPGAVLGSADYVTWAAMFPGADLSDPDADLDGDGNTNDYERIFGLDPTDAASVHPFTTLLDPAAGTFSFSRRNDALTGLFTDIETSVDLIMWTEDGSALLAPGTVDASTMVEIVDVTLSAGLLTAPKLFVRVNQNDGTILSENFETDGGGFTVATTAGSAWADGAPQSSSPGGTVTGGNGGSSNCWGTDIGNPGQYADSTVTRLRSTVIDLTDAAAAELCFAEAMDIDPGDTAVVNIIDDTDNNPATNVIAAAIYTATDPSNSDAAWGNANGGTPIDLTPYVGQAIRIEWSFTGFGGTSKDFLGWYIDDVSVRETMP